MNKIRVSFIIAAVVILAAASGCSLARKVFQGDLVEQAAEHEENTAALKETALKIIHSYGFYHGMITEALGGEAVVMEIYPSVGRAMGKLKGLYDKSQTGELTDEELGAVIGLHFRSWVATLQGAIRAFAPELISQVSFLFLL